MKPVAVVTGGGTGIGAAIVLKFHEQGYRVAIGALRKSDGEAIAARVHADGGEATAFSGDLTSPPVREQLIDGTRRLFGRLDVLVNCAAITGTAAQSEALQQPLAHFEQILDLNVLAAFACSQLAARVMLEQGGGAIVNVSSVAGSAAQEHAAAYCVSKAALDALTRSLALEWAKYGVRVNAVAPGDILTEASRETIAHKAKVNAPHRFERLTPLGRRGDPNEVASAVAFLASSEASFITGEILRVDGGFLCY